MSAAALVEFHGVGKRYADGTQALADLQLSIPSGQFCVVLGPSGAGKSTLLRMVNGLARPDSGSLSFDGRPLLPAQFKAVRAQIGSIHQHYALVPRLSVLDNVLCGALAQIGTLRSLLGLFGDARRRRACRLIAEAGLDEAHLYRRADGLSGGQQQRVGIARAFMPEPRLILADEPVASLDPRISRDILALLKTASRERGAAVLCTLHQVDLALEFADRIVGMRAGRVVFDGPPSAFDDAAHRALYAVAGELHRGRGPDAKASSSYLDGTLTHA